MSKDSKNKKFKVLTSLHENEKRNFDNNNDSDESDRDDRRRKTANEGEERNVQRTYNCDICHSDDPTLPAIGPDGIKFLSEDEQQILKFKNDLEVRILCLKHYQKEIRNWRVVRKRNCCNVLGKHKKAQKTNLRTISVKLAEEVQIFLGKKIIPCDSICQKCSKDLQLEIDRAKNVANDRPDSPVPEIFHEDISFETGSAEDLNENELKDLILRNICKENEVDEFTKEQKVGIIRVLPRSWSTREVSDKTGKIINKKQIKPEKK